MPHIKYWFTLFFNFNFYNIKLCKINWLIALASVQIFLPLKGFGQEEKIIYEDETFKNRCSQYWQQLNGTKATKPDSALIYINRFREYAKGYGDLPLYIGLRLQTAQTLQILNKPSKALLEFEKYIQEMEEHKLDVSPLMYLEIGNIYFSLNLIKTAKENYLKALNKKEKQYQEWIIWVAKNNIGMCLREEGNYDEAIRLMKEVRKARKSSKESLLGSAYDSFLLGETYRMQGDHNSASAVIYEGIKDFDISFPKAGIGDASSVVTKCALIMELIKINSSQNKTDSLPILFSQIVRHAEKYKAQIVLPIFYIQMAEIWIELNNANKALYYLKACSRIPQFDNKIKVNISFAESMQKALLIIGKIKEAEKWKTIELELKDSLHNQQNIKDIIELNSRSLENQRKALEFQKNKEIEQEKEIIQQERTQRWIALSLLITAAMVLITGFFFYRRINQNNKIISKQNEEKTLLIREIHHRVKNNLTVITSILDLQQRNIKEEATKQIFRDARARINSMALVHKNLYEQDQFSQINTQAYFENLIKTIETGYRLKGISIKTTVYTNQIQLNADTLVPLALIINELLTNTYKYAFNNLSYGNIDLTLNQNSVGYEFHYSDDGVGFKESEISKPGLGSQLIKGLAKQLEGKIEKVEDAEGTKYLILFKGINI